MEATQESRLILKNKSGPNDENCQKKFSFVDGKKSEKNAIEKCIIYATFRVDGVKVKRNEETHINIESFDASSGM